MAEQDVVTLEAAIEKARQAGVSLASHTLGESGSAGVDIVDEAVEWSRKVLTARAAARAFLTAALETPMRELDVSRLRSDGIDAAEYAGGLDDEGQSLLARATATCEEASAARAKAAEQLRAMRASAMAAQDVVALCDALEHARAVGVAQASYTPPESEQCGSEMIEAAVAWLDQVDEARSAARACLEAALQTDPAMLDTEHLAIHGLGAASVAGGVDLELLSQASAKLADVATSRARAVERLRELCGGSEQPTDSGGSSLEADSLGLALEQALAAGVAQPGYETEHGQRGSRLVHDAYARLSQLTRTAADRQADLYAHVILNLTTLLEQLQVRRRAGVEPGG